MKNSTISTLDQREADHAINNYTRVPNMLVDGYPELHPQDKWLFVCLVRLCGKEGTRYLSLRYIAERTGFSPSVLSDNKKNNKPGMLKRLHNAGLIHAEIKYRKGSNGKETNHAQYHITIADTWRLNYDFYNKEQDCSDSEQTRQDNHETVLNQNATVLIQNGIREDCSESERNCSDSGAIVRLQDKITESNKITERKNDDVPAQSTSSHSSIHSSSSHFQNSSKVPKPEEVTLTDEEQAIYEFGRETLFKAKPPVKTAKLKGECAELTKHITTLEQFQSLLQFVRALPYIKGQIHLKNLVNELNGWLQTQKTVEIATSSMQASPPGQTTNLRELYQMIQRERSVS